MSGPHFRVYCLLLSEHAEQLLSMTDPIAERARKLGVSTLKSIGHVALMQRIADNDEDCVPPGAMLAELRNDNRRLTSVMRLLHDVCDVHRDFATAGLLEKLIDETDRERDFCMKYCRDLLRIFGRSRIKGPMPKTKGKQR